ncbi:GNAT family N-acetyltransferase [Brasilonema sp. UFV-L1]|uniref:GNAT family N-acetyltransferase n=1 Tax=Brasilonema sp. UFV-L1 TaxID=2234130 RepID=UPI00145D3065|nr:GNAT family N-acetyltransferase [Brasilonema sp. UFV-L1]NMG10088.1 N-acetyltransferase [Brasilonema sp. UFV-L1]
MSLAANHKENLLISLRYDLQPGDLGRILQLHGTIYAQEYGFDYTFEGYVAQTLVHFCKYLDFSKERLWLAELEGKLVGCIGVIKASEARAQLRWLLVDPVVRGRGIGHRLLNEALEFAKHCGYTSIFLKTISELPVAGKLYHSAGFVKTVEHHKQMLWGQELIEEEYELHWNSLHPSIELTSPPFLKK